MNLENKNETIQPLKDEELENASGGKIQFNQFRYTCTACNYTGYSYSAPTECPQCHGPVTVAERSRR